MGAHPPVDLLSQADLIDYASDDPQVVDVLNFNLRLLSMFVHAPKNTSAREVNVRNVGTIDDWLTDEVPSGAFRG